MTAVREHPLAADPADRTAPQTHTCRGRDLTGLLPRIARGDERAFGTLYEEVAGPVLGLARHVLRDRAQAEEVAQEVLLEVWRTAARYRPERGEVLTWVLTITHRRAVDRVRSAQAAADRDRRVAAASHTPPFDEVAEAVERRIDRDRVRRCLGALTELQRQALALAYYGGYSQSQIAAILGAPLGTVKTRMRDGLIRMRDGLALHE
ncbi:ECF RNA polymerase sigma factor SigK [Kitasatospora sp. DSM 101779]|uniref:ECF RNA polymerase sigma factor SigK n=1 Tax=Kitasatospora sp. DSM 101779 TaxID=2853165 RepID=UPI0021D919B6|nr:ECF RNA polymerase sigma factor SigK [Kitasatospora sp. DSM 101779]MCU7820774.1 ECF RNA polymerase sigma factor SigK [Kitasatospora sp. DSM 101779]